MSQKGSTYLGGLMSASEIFTLMLLMSICFHPFDPSSSTGASAAPKMAAPLAARKVVVLVAQVVTWWLWGSLASRLQWGRVRSPVDAAELPGISLKRTFFFFPTKTAQKQKSTFMLERFSRVLPYNFHLKGSNNVNPFPPMDPKIIQPQPG